MTNPKYYYLSDDQREYMSDSISTDWDVIKMLKPSNVELEVFAIQHYIDTGGSVAGEYAHCAPNILEFTIKNYQLLKNLHLLFYSEKLFQSDLMYFILVRYQEWCWQTCEPLLINLETSK